MEERYVIETPIRIGDRQWRIEVTLANRDMMVYRMLLGRQAIPRDGLVRPSASFLQPRLHYKAYGRLG
jgi:ribosomal protein S6--L-glutamate ligase